MHTIKRKELPTELITNRQWEYADYTVLLDVSFADLDFLGGGWVFSTSNCHILYLFLIYHYDLSVFLWDFEIKILPLSVIGGINKANMGTFSKEVFLSADAEHLGVGANKIHCVSFLDAIL